MLLLLFIAGLFFGSFLNVLVDRIPRNENFIKGHSHCEFCKKTLQWHDLIPVLSFVFLKGKCRYCKHTLSILYPVMEISTGLLFVLTYLFIPSFSIVSVLYYLFIISGFIVIFFTDLKSGIIPDKILLPAILVTFLYLLIINPSSLIINILCGLGAFLFFVTIAVVFKVLTKKDSLGGGDIKLVFLLGLFLGFPGIVISLYIAFLTGALVGIILILWGKKRFKTATLPFGPFLILGTIFSLFWGNLIYLQVLHILGL
jgi:leader peptidase (prepilin peptidase)/N-methyltransferase